MKAREDEQKIQRGLYLVRALGLCIVPLLTVVLGNLVLLLVPQAREALRVGGEVAREAAGYGQSLATLLAFVVWMLSAWYSTRLLLGRRFDPDTLGPVDEDFRQAVTTLAPRA